MRRSDLAERQALADRVHPPTVDRACARCGIVTASTAVDAVVVSDRLNSSGVDLVFGTCDDCRCDYGDMNRTALVELLGVDPEDRALDGLTVTAFVNHPGSRPDRPNQTRWAHLNSTSLARSIEKNQADLDRRRCPDKRGCSSCGVDVTRPGTSWTRERPPGGEIVCGSCRRIRSEYNRNFRDVAASIVGGLSLSSQTVIVPGLGSMSGFLMASEAGVKKGSPNPWAHVDVRALRETIRDGAARRHFSVPGWWTPDRKVTW